MSDRNYFLIENRVICSEFDSQLSIISNPYKYNRYILMFLFYCLVFAFYVYALINYKEIYSSVKNNIENLWGILPGIILYFGLGCFVLYTLNGAPLIISVLKDTFFKNLFLKEELIITKDRFIFKKYNKEKFNILYNDIKEFYLDFQKETTEFSGVPVLVPNYRPVIHFVLLNGKRPIKIFETIERNEIKYVYEVITEKLIKNGILFNERQLDRRKTSLTVNFLSVTDFYLSSKHLFTTIEIAYLDANIESLETGEGPYYTRVIEKFKEYVLNKRSRYKIVIY